MRYIASLGDQRFTISVDENGQQRHLTLNGTAYAADWLPIGSAGGAASGAGRYSLLINNRSYEVVVRRLEADDEGGQRYEVLLAGQPYEVRLEDERERALASLAGGHESGDATIKAPMPGLVVNIPVAVGDAVQRGQTVAVLEAMKMENDLGAPRGGVVKEIKVVAGQAVNQGQPLVIVGETEAGAAPASTENGEITF